MTILTFQFSTLILNLHPPIETLKLVQAKPQRRQVRYWRELEFVNWPACRFVAELEFKLLFQEEAAEQADSLEMELERMMDSVGCSRWFQVFSISFPSYIDRISWEHIWEFRYPNRNMMSTLPKWVAASVCESDFPEEVSATQDAEKPRGVELISSDLYWSCISSMHYWYNIDV